MVAGDGEVVAVVELVGGGSLDLEVWLGHVREGPGVVVGEATDPGSCVCPVVRDTPVLRHVLAELLALLDTLHSIEHAVHGLEEDPQLGLVLAHPTLPGLGAVVLEEDHLLGGEEVGRPRQAGPVLHGQSTARTGGVVVD